jgi:hypothetical protein
VRQTRDLDYRVTLTFANPTDEERSFDLRLPDQPVASDFSSGGKMIGAIKSFADIESEGSLKLDLVARGPPARIPHGLELEPTAIRNQTDSLQNHRIRLLFGTWAAHLLSRKQRGISRIS